MPRRISCQVMLITMWTGMDFQLLTLLTLQDVATL